MGAELRAPSLKCKNEQMTILKLSVTKKYKIVHFHSKDYVKERLEKQTSIIFHQFLWKINCLVSRLIISSYP